MSIRKLYLELTDRCNLNCAICYRRSWRNSTGDMAEETYQRLLQNISELDELKEVVLGGIGEPTVSALFCTAVKALSPYDLTITTNGIIEDTEKVEIMARYAGKLVFSIDGLADRFSKIRGSSLEQVCQTIRAVQALKRKLNRALPEIYIQFVLSAENCADLPGVMKLAAELNARALIVSNLIPMTQESSQAILYSRYRNDEMKDYLNRACKDSLRMGLQVMLPHCEVKTERRCSYAESDAVFICASGEVSPCHRLSHSYDEFVFGRKKAIQPYSFGNINEQRLKALWDSKAYCQFREMVICNRYPSCIDCDLADGCDFARRSDMDCDGNTPACGDCLWSRRIAICL